MPGLSYPTLIDATGRCPPEDVGGPPGYSDLFEILADPRHERYAEMMEWIGDTFDPRSMEIEDHAIAVDALPRKWTRKPAVKRKPTK